MGKQKNILFLSVKVSKFLSAQKDKSSIYIFIIIQVISGVINEKIKLKIKVISIIQTNF